MRPSLAIIEDIVVQHNLTGEERRGFGISHQRNSVGIICWVNIGSARDLVGDREWQEGLCAASGAVALEGGTHSALSAALGAGERDAYARLLILESVAEEAGDGWRNADDLCG